VLAAGRIASCGSDTGTTVASSAAASGTPAPASERPSAKAPAATVEVSADTSALEHIHNLGLTGDTLLIGSHQGLFRQPPGQPPRRVGEPFDVMGFTITGNRWLASGHPGEGMNAPPDLGLLESDDEGATWADVSLAGQADFHRLTASSTTVLGVNSGHGMLWRSTDSGRTWTTGGPGPFDLALNPRNHRQAVGTTQDGPITSDDGGKTWKPLTDAPLIALLAWTDEGLWGVTPDGKVYESTDAGKTWRKTGQVDGEPSTLAATRTHINVLAGDTIWESLDQGATFTPRVTGIPGH